MTSARPDWRWPRVALEQRCGDARVDQLVWSHVLGLVAAEVEECLPADEPPRCARSTAQVDRVGLAFGGRIGDEPVGVPWQVLEQPAVAEPEGGTV
jgi:hypothetical protein